MEIAGIEPKAIECPVCHEYYKEPKILPCAHLLCRHCLISWMKTNENAQCPLCRCAISDPNNLEVKTCEDVADQLPTDDVMSEMVDNIKILHQKGVCHVHEDIKATSFCLNCGLMLCATCAEIHIKIPAISFHKLEDLETLTLESLTSSRQSLCPAHPDRASELYCAVHDIFICSACALSKHRSCPAVLFLNDMLPTNTRLLSDLESRLGAVESTLNLAMAEIEERLVTLQQTTKDSLTQIDAACDRLLMLIENCRKHLRKLVQDENDDLMTCVNKQKDVLSNKRGIITFHRSLINRIQLSASGTSLISMVPRLNKRVNDLDLKAPLLSDWKPLNKAKLTIDDKALSRIELELARLGRLSINSTILEKQTVWRFHTNHSKNIVLKDNDMTAELKGNGLGMVFSSETMKVNTLYEVRVEETNPGFGGTDVGIGLVTEDPAMIAPLPWYSTGLQSAIVVCGDGIFVQTERTQHNCGDAYNTFTVGSCIGVLVDATRCLHIYVDGKDQGVVYRNVQLPCWAMFDMYFFLRKVSVLPLISVP